MIRYFLIFILLLLTLCSNFYSFKNLRAEYHFKRKMYYNEESISYKYVDSIFPSFPNVSSVGSPIDLIKATAALKEGNISLGIDHLNKSRIINPYTHVADVIMAKYYLSIGNLYEAKYYATEAFKNWPKNEQHFSIYNQVLTELKDTLAIMNAFISLPQNIKEQQNFQNIHFSSINKAKLKYLITDYPSAKFPSKRQLLGNWIRGYNFPNQFVKDTTLTYEFTEDQMITKDGSIYHYELKNDSIYISFYESRKLLNKYPIKFSDSLETLILGNVKILNGNLQDQFFKKIDEY